MGQCCSGDDKEDKKPPKKPVDVDTSAQRPSSPKQTDMTLTIMGEKVGSTCERHVAASDRVRDLKRELAKTFVEGVSAEDAHLFDLTWTKPDLGEESPRAKVVLDNDNTWEQLKGLGLVSGATIEVFGAKAVAGGLAGHRDTSGMARKSTQQLVTEMTDDDVQDLFKQFDSDKNGSISKQEFGSVFRDISGDALVEDSEIDKWWTDLDLNADGEINFDEFQKAFKEGLFK